MGNFSFCNATADYEEIHEVPLWNNYRFHDFGLALSAVFGLIAIILSVYLMFMHATHYHKPWEQRHIIRIIFMVPIYSLVSFLSYKYYLHAIYFDVARDCYEAFAIASFFSLMCHYVAPDLHAQKNYFRELTPLRDWVWPLNWVRKCTGGEHGLLRTPRNGLTWFNIIWFGVFQYCLVRVLCTLTALGTQVIGRYCADSLSPAFAHIWVIVMEGSCVSVAMYCLIQFYVQLRHDLAEHRPFLKVLAIKLVIFLSFWQTIVINILTSLNVIKETPQLASPDVKIGIPALLLCVEMAMFSILHLWAYPWRPYHQNRSPIVTDGTSNYPPGSLSSQGGFLGYKAFLQAFNPWDIVKAVARGFKWIFHGRRYRGQELERHKNTSNPGDSGIALHPAGGVTTGGKYQQLHEADNDDHSQLGVRPIYDHLPYPATYSIDPRKATSYDPRNQSGVPMGIYNPQAQRGMPQNQNVHELDPRNHWANA